MRTFVQLLCLIFALVGCTTLSPVTSIKAPQELQTEVHTKDVVVLTVFGAEWCQFCKDFDAKIPALQEKYGDSLRIVLVDTDKFPMAMFGIPAEGIPFFVISLEGHVVSAGNGTIKDVEDVLDEATARLKEGVKPLPRPGNADSRGKL